MSDFSRPLVISGPSGSGKSTLLSRLFSSHPGKFGLSVSHTTRTPRPGEEDGKHYYFVTRDTFNRLINEGAFIEHAHFSGNFYGTSFMAVDNVTASGRRCLLDIDSQIKQTNLNAIYLFISPPSLAALRERLKGRGTETEASINARLDTAVREIEYARMPDVHDIVIVNDELDKAYASFEKVALGESGAIDLLPKFDE